MSATAQEIVTSQDQYLPSPEQITENVIGFVATQNEGIINTEQLQAMAVLVGPTVLANCVVDLQAKKFAEVEFNDELQISQVTIFEQIGHMAVGTVTSQPEAEPSPADQPHDPDSTPDSTRQQASGEVSTEDLSELELTGVTAGVAIVNYLTSKPDYTLSRGDARSAGSVLIEKLSAYGHTPAAISQALRVLNEQGVINLDKPTPKAKIIRSISLDENAKKNS